MFVRKRPVNGSSAILMSIGHVSLPIRLEMLRRRATRLVAIGPSPWYLFLSKRFLDGWRESFVLEDSGQLVKFLGIQLSE